MKKAKAKNTLGRSAQKMMEGTDHVRRSFGARMRGYFIAGILVTAPISITIYLTYLFLTAIDGQVAKILPVQWYEVLDGGTTVPGLGLLVAIVFFIIVGWFATNILGRFFIRIAEYFVDRVPVIRTIYSAIKQIFETIMATQSNAFREVVMLEYPRRGTWSIGFVTGRTEGQVQRVTAQETVNVFVPTTPNPTSGYLLFVPKKELKYLDMTVEEGVKLVVSAGIITPSDRGAKKPATKKAAAKTTTAKTPAKRKAPAKKPVAKKPVAKPKAKAKTKK